MNRKVVVSLVAGLFILFSYQNCGQGVPGGEENLSSLTQSIVDEDGNYRLPEEVALDPDARPTIYLRNAETSNGEDMIFEILLNKSLSVMVEFEVETFDGSGIAGTHYERTRKTLQIPPGQKVIVFPVSTLGAVELLEPVIFGLRIVKSSIPVGQSVSGGLIRNLQTPMTFRKIEAGGFHSCGLDPEGHAWCWGYNRTGQLGADVGSSQVIPIAVSGGSQYKSLALSVENTCGIRTDDILECWGGNTSGQLGNGSTLNSFLPVRPSNLPPVKSVAVGYRAICAVTLADQLYCWGDNNSQRLGLNSLQASIAIPTLVKLG